MPTYEYHCDACEHRFEEFQSMKDDPLTKCPQCGQQTLRRLFGSGAAILFKGSGFYQTDYRSESYRAAAKADQEAGKPAAKGDQEASKPAANAGSNGSDGTSGKGTASGDSRSTAKSAKSKG